MNIGDCSGAGAWYNNGVTMNRSAYQRRMFLLRVMRALRIGQRQAVLVQALLLGLAGAVAALAFDAAIDAVQWVYTGFAGTRVDCFMQLPGWARVLLPAAGAIPAALVLLFAMRVDKRPMPEYMESFSLGDGRLPRRQGFLRSLSAVLSMGSGACIGKVGAIIQASAVAASAAGRALHVSPSRLRLLVGCGAAAGMTAAIHTPLSACLFVCEVLVGTFSIGYMAPLLAATCASYALLWLLGRTDAIFAADAAQVVFGSLPQVLLCAVLAVAAALCGRGWVWFAKWMRRRLDGRPAWLPVRMAAAGLLVGLVAYEDPFIVGNGQEAIAALLAGCLSTPHAAALLCCKVLLVAVVFGVGTMGGMLMPTLMIGCFIGALFGAGAESMGLGGGALPYALVGMAAFFGVAARAPITALLLVIEFTMNASLIFPLMLAVAVAYGVARLLPAGSLYDRAPDSTAFDGPPSALRVEDVMRRSPLQVHTSAPLDRVLHQMLRHPDENVPVVEADGRYAGLILASELPDTPDGSAATASDLMHADAPVLSPADGLPEALRAFQSTPLNSLPVVNPATGALCGIVSRTELYRTGILLLRKAVARD